MHDPTNMLVDDARNDAVEYALEMGAKYLQFFDDDVLMPGHTFKQLVYRLENHDNVDICGGIYCNKNKPPFPLVFDGDGRGSYWDWRIGEFKQVTGLGMGMTIIRTSLLKRMEPPWFKTERHLRMRDDGVAESFAQTEDLYFCRKAREGYDAEVWADFSLIGGHIDHSTGEVFELPIVDSKPVQPSEGMKAKKKILNLGSGHSKIHFEGEGPSISVDLRPEVQPDYQCDLRQLPFDDAYADIVYSSHALEHFGRWEVEDVLDEWLRVLKPGGELRLVLPSVLWAAEQLVNGGGESEDVFNVLCGSQDYALNYHKMHFTPALVEDMMKRRKLKVTRMDTEGYNIIAVGQKPKKRKRKKK
jgi:predicted SAM-dependent methyltransferase